MDTSPAEVAHDSAVFRTKEELVRFTDVLTQYGSHSDMKIRYRLGSRVRDTGLDWIGIFPSGWRGISHPLTFQWAPIRETLGDSPHERSATFPRKMIQPLQHPSNTYQLVYVNKQGQAVGTSSSFLVSSSTWDMDETPAGAGTLDEELVSADVRSGKSGSLVLLTSDDGWDYRTTSSHITSSSSFSDLSDLADLSAPSSRIADDERAPMKRTDFNTDIDNADREITTMEFTDFNKVTDIGSYSTPLDSVVKEGQHRNSFSDLMERESMPNLSPEHYTSSNENAKTRGALSCSQQRNILSSDSASNTKKHRFGKLCSDKNNEVEMLEQRQSIYNEFKQFCSKHKPHEIDDSIYNQRTHVPTVSCLFQQHHISGTDSRAGDTGICRHVVNHESSFSKDKRQVESGDLVSTIPNPLSNQKTIDTDVPGLYKFPEKEGRKDLKRKKWRRNRREVEHVMHSTVSLIGKVKPITVNPSGDYVEQRLNTAQEEAPANSFKNTNNEMFTPSKPVADQGLLKNSSTKSKYEYTETSHSENEKPPSKYRRLKSGFLKSNKMRMIEKKTTQLADLELLWPPTMEKTASLANKGEGFSWINTFVPGIKENKVQPFTDTGPHVAVNWKDCALKDRDQLSKVASLHRHKEAARNCALKERDQLSKEARLHGHKEAARICVLASLLDSCGELKNMRAPGKELGSGLLEDKLSETSFPTSSNLLKRYAAEASSSCRSTLLAGSRATPPQSVPPWKEGTHETGLPCEKASARGTGFQQNGATAFLAEPVRRACGVNNTLEELPFRFPPEGSDDLVPERSSPKSTNCFTKQNYSGKVTNHNIPDMKCDKEFRNMLLKRAQSQPRNIPDIGGKLSNECSHHHDVPSCSVDAERASGEGAHYLPERVRQVQNGAARFHTVDCARVLPAVPVSKGSSGVISDALTWPLPTFIRASLCFGPWVTQTDPPTQLQADDEEAPKLWDNFFHVQQAAGPNSRSVGATPPADQLFKKSTRSKPRASDVVGFSRYRAEIGSNDALDMESLNAKLDNNTRYSELGSEHNQSGDCDRKPWLRSLDNLKVMAVKYSSLSQIQCAGDVKSMVRSKAKITVLRSKVTSSALQVRDLVGQIARLKKSLKIKSRSAARARFKWLQLKNKVRDQKVKLIHMEVTKKRAAVKRTKNQAGDVLVSETPCKRRRTCMKTDTSFLRPKSQPLPASLDEPKRVFNLGPQILSKIPAGQAHRFATNTSTSSYTQPRPHQTRTSSDFSGSCMISGFPAAYNARQETTDPQLQTSWACRNPALSTTACYPNVLPSYIDQLLAHSHSHSPEPTLQCYHPHTQVAHPHTHSPEPTLQCYHPHTQVQHSATLYAHPPATPPPPTPTLPHYSSQTPTYSSLSRSQKPEPSSTNTQYTHLFKQPLFQTAYPSHSLTSSCRPTSPLIFPVHSQLCPLSCNNSRNKSTDSSITVNEEVISPLSSPRILPITNFQRGRNHTLPVQTQGDAISSQRLAELEGQACSNVGNSSPFPLHGQQRFFEHPGLSNAHVLDSSLYWPHEEVKDDRPVFKAKNVVSRPRPDSRVSVTNVLSPSRLFSHPSASFVLSQSDRASHVTSSNGRSPSRRDSHVTDSNVLFPPGRCSNVSATNVLALPGRDSHVNNSNKVFYTSSPDPHDISSYSVYTPDHDPHVNRKSPSHKSVTKVKACVTPFHISETSPNCAVNKDKTFAFASAATICQESVQEESLSNGLSRWLKSMTREGPDYFHTLDSFSNVPPEEEQHMELDESCELLNQSMLSSENPASFTQFQSCFLRHLDQDEPQQQLQARLENQHNLFLERSEHNCRQKHQEASLALHPIIKKHRRHRHSLCIPPSELPFPPLSPFHHPSTTQLQRTSGERTLSELLNQSIAQGGPQSFFSVENLDLSQQDGKPVPSHRHLKHHGPFYNAFSQNMDSCHDPHYQLGNLLTEHQKAVGPHDLSCVSLFDSQNDTRQIEASLPCQGEREI